jgi:hypothetical protein
LNWRTGGGVAISPDGRHILNHVTGAMAQVSIVSSMAANRYKSSSQHQLPYTRRPDLCCVSHRETVSVRQSQVRLPSVDHWKDASDVAQRIVIAKKNDSQGPASYSHVAMLRRDASARGARSAASASRQCQSMQGKTLDRACSGGSNGPRVLSGKRLVEEIVKTYHVTYERDESGRWVASVRGLRGCHTQGRTWTKLGDASSRPWSRSSTACAPRK